MNDHVPQIVRSRIVQSSGITVRGPTWSAVCAIVPPARTAETHASSARWLPAHSIAMSTPSPAVRSSSSAATSVTDGSKAALTPSPSACFRLLVCGSEM